MTSSSARPSVTARRCLRRARQRPREHTWRTWEAAGPDDVVLRRRSRWPGRPRSAPPEAWRRVRSAQPAARHHVRVAATPGGRGTGMRASTVVPRPGPDRMLTVPRWRAARRAHTCQSQLGLGHLTVLPSVSKPRPSSSTVESRHRPRAEAGPAPGSRTRADHVWSASWAIRVEVSPRRRAAGNSGSSDSISGSTTPPEGLERRRPVPFQEGPA